MINHVGITVYEWLKYRETSEGKPLLHKYEYNLARKCVCNYIAAVGMITYLKGYTLLRIYIAVHQCAQSSNDPRLVHERDVIRITNYLSSISTYVEIQGGSHQLYTQCVFHRPNKGKSIKCYVDTAFASGWDQENSNNEENVVSRQG